MSYIVQPLFAPLQLANAEAAIYTSSSARTQVQQFVLTNPSTTTAYWAKLWWVTSGGTATDADLIFPQTVIFPGQTVIVTGLIGQTLGSADSIHAQAQTAAKINAFASGLVMSP